jgi:hypothetical protein
MTFKTLFSAASIFTLTMVVAVTPPLAADVEWTAEIPKLEMPEGWFLIEVPAVLQTTAAKRKPGPIYVLTRSHPALLKFSADGKLERRLGHVLL